nr:RHS repeat-associated core domain-containing protein [Agrobacterium sp. rho-13.3]MDX8310232.1 RHS repeat-associated core domain-containing protein [Agrobacterium sp. rho-13.3]
MSKADSFGTTHFLWDGDLMVHSQRGGRESLFVYESASFVPLASIQGTEENRHTYWYQCDQIGAPLELTDAQGRIAWAADYKVWGEATLRAVARTGTDDAPDRRRIGHGPRRHEGDSASGRSFVPPPIEQPFRFQGQQFDEETGLHYNRFRYYDPTIGRFASQDPIGLNGGENLFIYSNNPSAWIDPLGLAATAGSLANRAQNLPASSRPNTVAVIRHKDGTITAGRNQGGQANDEVSNKLKNIPQNPYSGECAEVNAIARARNKGRSLEGAVITVVDVRGKGSVSGKHGKPKCPCDVCSELLKAFGVKYVIE